MIFDKLSNLHKYTKVHPRFEEAFGFLESSDPAKLGIGRHPVSGDEIYASVNEYSTRPEGFLEAHRKYIDIQIITRGSERIGFALLNSHEVKDEYDQQKDIAFYYGDCDYLTLEPACFAIFFPEDLHKPGICAKEPTEVKKIVLKIQV
jgi:YhcH/YjgK/YiaL family protein